MKILTWNVNLYMNREESAKREYRVLQAVLGGKADILFLQEASDTFIFDLEKNGYKLQGKTLCHGGWCCALTKIPTDSVKIANAVGVAITVNEKTLATCHLAPGGVKNREFRSEQLKEFLGLLDLVCGDFNDEKLQIPSLTRMTNEKTWFLDFFQRGSPVSKKYDHVYCNPRTVVVNNLIVGKYGNLSDHVPVYFEI